MTTENITPEQIQQVDTLLTTLLNNISAFRLNFNLIIKMMEDIGGLEVEIAEYSKSVQLFESKGLSMELSDKLDFLYQHGFLINEYHDHVAMNSLQKHNTMSKTDKIIVAAIFVASVIVALIVN